MSETFLDSVDSDLAARFQACKRESERRTRNPELTDERFLAILLEAWELAEREEAAQYRAREEPVEADEDRPSTERRARADGGVDPAAVRRAVCELADERTCIKSRHVAQEMGIENASKPVRGHIGRELKALEDAGVLSQWSSSGALGGATFRIENADALEVRADGGQPSLRRFTGECRCGRTVVTAVRRTRQEMCSDPTARARCTGCGRTVIVAGDPPADARRARADGGNATDDSEQSRTAFHGWLKCPACDSEAVEWSYGNGRFRLHCEECNAGFSKLIGRHDFRPRRLKRDNATTGSYREGGEDR